MEIHSLEEVAYWAKKKHLGSDSDPMETRIANLVVATALFPWPHTLGLARVVVAPGQKLCSLTEAMDLAREHFDKPKGLEEAYYYLTPRYVEAPYLLSDVGIEVPDEDTAPIGVAAFRIDAKSNKIDLSTSQGLTATLMLQCLLHLSNDLVLIPLQLSIPGWTGMRRMKVRYESFICFSASYLPPDMPESQCLSQWLVLLRDLKVPEPQVLLDMADQLDQAKGMPPQSVGHDVGPEDKQDDSKEETPKKDKPSGSEDGPKKKKKHKSRESHLRHSLVDKLSTPSPNEAGGNFNSTKLGTAMAQACLSVVKMTQVVEDRHNSRIVDAFLMKKKLEEASAGVIKLMMDDIRAARTPADMWRIKKRLSVHISTHWAKAFDALAALYKCDPESHQGRKKDMAEAWDLAEAEANLHKSMTDLVSTVIAEGMKVPGGQGVDMTLNILQLVPSLPSNPVVATCTDLPPEREFKVVTWDPPRPPVPGPSAPSLLPSSPPGAMGGSSVSRKPAIKFGQAINAVVWPITHMPPAKDTGFFRKPFPATLPAPHCRSGGLHRQWVLPCPSPLFKDYGMRWRRWVLLTSWQETLLGTDDISILSSKVRYIQ